MTSHRKGERKWVFWKPEVKKYQKNYVTSLVDDPLALLLISEGVRVSFEMKKVDFY